METCVGAREREVFSGLNLCVCYSSHRRDLSDRLWANLNTVDETHWCLINLNHIKNN
jgi:hypothetical protein